jgi:hypothetical protein
MERATSIEPKTSFNCLPNEIIFLIFDYLSYNDIIYTFFFLNQRLNNLLLKNQHYSNYLELPTTNLDTWEIILSIIGSQIKCLNITTIDLSFPLRYFPNLKSLIISSLYGLSEEILKYIIENNQFQNLSSFKIKHEKIFTNPYLPDNVIYVDNIFEKVFNQNNSLEIFEYSLMIRCELYACNLQINLNLHSLILALTSFHTIFDLIQYTPNLKYLKVKTGVPFANSHPINTINIKLKQLHLTLSKINEYVDFDRVIDGIKQFSSSLICLSLDLVDYSVRGINEFSFSRLKLPQLSESMKELKQFHFYFKLPSFQYNNDVDLSQFEAQHCFNHNSSFGMHDDYLYTLPFHFRNFYECFQDFNDVKLNNYEILKNNSRIWYNVKSIQLPVRFGYNRNFVEELKTKMPKLTLIRFNSYPVLSEIETHDSFGNKLFNLFKDLFKIKKIG